MGGGRWKESGEKWWARWLLLLLLVSGQVSGRKRAINGGRAATVAAASRHSKGVNRCWRAGGRPTGHNTHTHTHTPGTHAHTHTHTHTHADTQVSRILRRCGASSAAFSAAHSSPASPLSPSSSSSSSSSPPPSSPSSSFPSPTRSP